MLKYFAFIFFVMSVCNYSFAYDDVSTHPNLTYFAVQKSIFKLDNDLSNKFGFDFAKNYNTIVDGELVIDWLKKGSIEEDHPNCRAASHFLDPLKPWKDAGVSDTSETIIGFFVNPGCFVMAPFSSRYSIHKYADVTWATGLTAPGSEVIDTGNDMDWNAAREYYRLALTTSDNATREGNFAKTFQALGQVIHLLQDMAVPAHVRNDFSAHTCFQKKGGDAPKGGFGNTYEWYVKANETSLQSVMKSSIDVPTPNLLTALWDANKYSQDGSNPSGEINQGLAEYTNANFFSESTIFTEHSGDIHAFPRPERADTDAAYAELQAEATEVTAEDGVQDKVFFVNNKTGGYKLAAYSFCKKRVEETAVNASGDLQAVETYVGRWGYNLNEEVYGDYARKLIPRAVGYSAALLDYFFRGQLEISLPARGVYALSEGVNGAGFSQVRLRARNTTAGTEVMLSGQVTLVARYKVAELDPFQGREVPVGAEVFYNVATLKNADGTPNKAVKIPRGTPDEPPAEQKPAELTFDFDPPIPLWATDLTLQLVYSGRLGNETPDGFTGEEDAVAVGFANVSEPSPYDFINDTDLICLNGVVVESGSAEALAARDVNGEPIYWNHNVFPTMLRDIYLKFSPPTQPLAASSGLFDVNLTELPPGSYLRFYYIADTLAATTNYSHQVQPLPIDERDLSQPRLNRYSYGIEGLINEEVVENGVTRRLVPIMFDIRGLPTWRRMRMLKVSYPATTSCLISTASKPHVGPVPLTFLSP